MDCSIVAEEGNRKRRAAIRLPSMTPVVECCCCRISLLVLETRKDGILGVAFDWGTRKRSTRKGIYHTDDGSSNGLVGGCGLVDGIVCRRCMMH